MRAIRKSLVIGVGVVTACCLVCLAGLSAQDSKAKAPAKAKGAQPGKVSEQDWPGLVKRKQDFLKQIDRMKQQFDEAEKSNDDELRQSLVRKFQAMQREFVGEVQPGLIQLAPRIYAKDPTDVDAAEIVITEAFQENKYRQVIEMVGRVFEAGKKSAPLLTFLGVSQFATHDFTKAEKTLTEAQEADENVFPAIGRPFLEASSSYINYWKQEQAIRAKEKQAGDLPQVVFKTTKGEIVFELFENEAPNTVANFISLVEKKKYDGIRFHRVLPNFMAQGGDPNTLDDDPQNDGQGGPGYTIPCECFNEGARLHFQGSLSMAHAGRDTGGSQFFITHLPTPHLNPRIISKKSSPNGDGDEDAAVYSGHTVFGRVIKGLDVALALRIGDEIDTAKVLRKRDHEYVPETIPEARTPGRKGTRKKSQ